MMKPMMRRILAISILFFSGLLLGGTARATSFTVHSWEWGTGNVEFLRDGTVDTVHAALLQATLDGYGDGFSFCVDLDHYIGAGGYNGLVLDPGDATTETRNYAGAAAIANYWTYHLEDLGSRGDAITGVQAAIWDVLYGDALTILSLGSGAQSAYDQVMAQLYSGYGNTVLVDLTQSRYPKQSQVFTPAVPEPSAALVFALGGLIITGVARRRS